MLTVVWHMGLISKLRSQCNEASGGGMLAILRDSLEFCQRWWVREQLDMMICPLEPRTAELCWEIYNTEPNGTFSGIV